jgi:pyrroloquinoline quinone (PQQ) biosynthesis protein C
MVSELENKLRTMADLMHSMEKQTNQYLQEKVSELLRHVHEIDDNVF